MTDIDPIRDLRFEGMDIPQLRDWINQIKQGAGTESMQSAVRALEECVQVVTDLDDTLRRELGKLQINWVGNAGDLAAEATRQRDAVLADAPDPLARSASSVEGQGEGFESARHKLPNTDELRHQESENFFEWAGGGFGYESDYDAEAKRIDAQKKAAQAALAGYRDTSVEHADAYRPLPTTPAGTVQVGQPSGSVPSAGIGSMPTGSDAGGTAVGGFVGGTAGRSTVGGANPGTAPVPGARQGESTPAPGQRTGEGRVGAGEPKPAEPRDPRRPEPEIPDEPGGSEQPEEHVAQLGERQDDDGGGIGTGTALGLAAGGAAVLGGGAYAAKRLLGGKGAATTGGPATGGEAKNAAPRAGSSTGVAPGDVVAGKTAGKTPGSRPAAGSMLSPAATRGENSEDGEHENDYAVEETPFDDERLVAPAVLGEDAEEPGEHADQAGEDSDEPEKRD